MGRTAVPGKTPQTPEQAFSKFQLKAKAQKDEFEAGPLKTLCLTPVRPDTCSAMRVIDTKILTPPDPDTPKSKMKWRESWHMDHCGTVVENEILFEAVPSGGTTFKIGP